jgi:hypothetical protein
MIEFADITAAHFENAIQLSYHNYKRYGAALEFSYPAGGGCLAASRPIRLRIKLLPNGYDATHNARMLLSWPISNSG